MHLSYSEEAFFKNTTFEVRTTGVRGSTFDAFRRQNRNAQGTVDPSWDYGETSHATTGEVTQMVALKHGQSPKPKVTQVCGFTTTESSLDTRQGSLTENARRRTTPRAGLLASYFDYPPPQTC
uniref:Uncharacterized protein n=1 Tax=Magnusiomyces tetraspermus TaxID=1232584 RepID=A0A023UNJ3_9ASCO|nr:hypothetical protein [Magnusiomyces tetraspermus]AHY04943.1 hypothetical protein [Magnusiomyces tetraspermus]